MQIASLMLQNRFLNCTQYVCDTLTNLDFNIPRHN